MEAIKEITEWGEGYESKSLNHIYLMDGDRAVAYIKQGKGSAQYFNAPFRLKKTGRKFVKADIKLFDKKLKSTLIEVKGSKGNSYFVDPKAKTCTCPGFTFHGKCKHIK